MESPSIDPAVSNSASSHTVRLPSAGFLEEAAMPSSETAPAGATASAVDAPITSSLPDETRPPSSAPTEPALASPAPNASSSATPEPSMRSPSTASTRTTESRVHHALGTPSRAGSRTTSSAALRITSLSADALLPFGASPTDRGRGNGLGNGHGAGSPVGTPIQSVYGKPFAAQNLPPTHSPGAGVSYSGMARSMHPQHSPIPRIDEMSSAAIAQTPLFGESDGAGAIVFSDAAIPAAAASSDAVNHTNALRNQKPAANPVRNLAASRHPPRPHPPPPPPPVPKAALVPRTSTFASPPKALRHASSSAATTHAPADDQQPMPFVTTRALGRHALGAARGRRTLNGAPKRVAPPKLAPLADGVLLDGFFLLSAAEVELPEFVHSLSLLSRNLTMVLEEDLVHFCNLRFLDISDNNVPLPSLAALPALRELCMHCNGISAFVIDNFVRPQPQPQPPCFARLQKLDLSFNGLNPASIAELTKMPELRELNLTGNDLASIPADWSGFSQLTRLVLARNQLRDATLCLVALASCPRLHELDLSQNLLECVPIALSRLPANACFPCLIYLDLSRNYVCSEAAVLPLAHCPRLELLDLRKNLLVVGGAADAAPTGIHFVSKTMPAKSRVTSSAFPAIARELVQAKGMVVLIEDAPPPPNLPLPSMQSVQAEAASGEDGNDRSGEESSAHRDRFSIGTAAPGAADDIMADPDFQSDVGTANVYAAMSTDGYQSRGSTGVGSYATMGHTPIDAFPPMPLHGMHPAATSFAAPSRAYSSTRVDVNFACNKLRYLLEHSVTHGSPRRVTGETAVEGGQGRSTGARRLDAGDMKHGAHVHRTNQTMRRRMQLNPRVPYESRFVPPRDAEDPLDLVPSGSEPESASAMATTASRSSSRNWAIKAAGTRPHALADSRLAGTATRPHESAKSRALMVEQLLQNV